LSSSSAELCTVSRALATGQQVAISGTVVGYYLFKRNEANKVDLSDPWDGSDEEAVELADAIE
jgi:predicted peroxiredoxin